MTTQLIPNVFALNTATSAGDVVPDARFGQVTSLNANSAFTVTALKGNEVCLSVWVKRQRVTDDIQLKLNTGGWRIANSGLVLLDEQETGHIIPQEQWHQLTLVQTHNAAKLYVNGVLVHSLDKDYPVLSGNLGYVSASGNVQLAQQHTYDYALDATAVQAGYVAGLPVVKKTFAQKQPIGFALTHPENSLYSGAIDNALLIVDATRDDQVNQVLEVTNTSANAIHIPGSNAPSVDGDNFLFELRFRNGVFERIEETFRFNAQSDWHISAPVKNAADGSWSVYFLTKTSVTLNTGGKLIFPFSYRTVNNALQERPTVFSLAYQNMQFGDDKPICGDRNQPMTVANLSSNNQYLTELNKQIEKANGVVNSMEKATQAELSKLKEELEKARNELVGAQSSLADTQDSLVNAKKELLEKASQQDVTNTIEKTKTAIEGGVSDKISTSESALRKELGLAQIDLQAKIDEAQNKIDEEQNRIFTDMDNKILTAISGINKRLEALDDEVDLRASAKDVKNLKVLPPFAAFGYSANGLVTNHANCDFEIRLRNTSGEKLTFDSSGKVRLSIAVGSQKDDLVSSSSKAGGCTTTLGSMKTPSGNTPRRDFECNLSNKSLNADAEVVFYFNDFTPNELAGQSLVEVEIAGVKNYKNQHLVAALHKVNDVAANNVVASNDVVASGNVVAKDTLKAYNLYLADSWADITWKQGDNLQFGTVVAPENGPVTKNNNFVERMRISNSGNVGIGDNSPSDKLEVAGNVRAERFVDRNDTSYYVDPAGTSKLSTVEAVGDVKGARFVDRNNTSYYVDPTSTSRLSSIDVDGDVKGARFVDRNSSGYYVDPSSTSNVNHLTAKGYLRGNGYYIHNLNANNIASGTISRHRLPNIRLSWSGVYTTGYVNWWDDGMNYYLPSGAVMVGLESYHSNHREDRRWRIKYRYVSVTY